MFKYLPGITVVLTCRIAKAKSPATAKSDKKASQSSAKKPKVKQVRAHKTHVKIY